jgi:hypothetical protein
MEFNVGIIQGENFRFAARTSWPSTKLTVEAESLVLTTGFKSIEFPKRLITKLSDYEGFCWLFARGIRIKHSEEKNPPFFVFWAFDLAPIKRCLAESGFTFGEPDES